MATAMLVAAAGKNPGVGRPIVTRHHQNGSTSVVWYVDNNDDRYVEVADSAASDDFLLVYRDHRDTFSIVLADAATTILHVERCLDRLAGKGRQSLSHVH